MVRGWGVALSCAATPIEQTVHMGFQVQSAKAVIEVVAGTIPGQDPDPVYTKRFALPTHVWEELGTDRLQQMAALAELNGRAQGYAGLLMLSPDRLNWVRVDWIWV